MKPYVLVKGSTKDISAFEDKISSALEEGYEFSGDLITKKIDDAMNELVLLQPMVMEEDLDFNEEDFEEMQEALNRN